MPKIDEEEGLFVSGGPVVDEAYPALGRRSGYLAGERAASGGLPDEPDDGAALAERSSFRQTGSRR